MASEQIVTPWEVKSIDGIDYEKLVRDFGCSVINGDLIKRFESVTGVKAHHYLRRGIFFSHKDLDKILDEYEKGEQIYLYTGRGPSSESMHIGHLVPMIFTKYLQDAFQAIVIIQMSDDEKYSFKNKKEGKDLEHYNRLAYENAKDIIACGFDPDRTYIFSNLRTLGGYLYENVTKIDACFTGNKMRGIYGLTLDNYVGEMAWPSKQCAPAFSSSFPEIFHPDGKYADPTPDGFRAYIGPQIYNLVPMAVDQDPYFRMARDVADMLKSKGFLKPSVIHSKFIPSLGGMNGKMSSSTGDATIFLDMKEKEIRKIINKCTASGGHTTIEDQRRYGGDITIDIAYQLLCILEPDDDKLKTVAQRYTSGEMLSGEIKKELADVVVNLINGIQRVKTSLSEEDVRKFFNKNRRFNTTRVKRDPVQLESDEKYANYGAKFDLTFGYSCKLSPSELEKQKATV